MSFFKEKIKFDTAWWSSTTSSIVGTMVGIIITFGVNDCINKQHKKEIQHTTVVMAINSIKSSIDENRKTNKSFLIKDSIFMNFYNMNVDTINRVDKSQIAKFIAYFMSRDFSCVDNTSEKIFSSSIETWESIEDPRFMEITGKCFNMINYIADLNKEIIEKQFQLFDSYCLNNNRETDIATYAKKMIQNSSVRWYIELHHNYYLPGLIQLNRALDEQCKEIMKIANVSEEEITEYRIKSKIKEYTYNKKIEKK